MKADLDMFFMCRDCVKEIPKQKRRFSSVPTATKKLTIDELNQKSKSKKPITMVTSYDYTSAHWLNQSEIDMLLVGDSLGMVMLGHKNTQEVTMDVRLFLRN
jgi:hypothetical protein